MEEAAEAGVRVGKSGEQGGVDGYHGLRRCITGGEELLGEEFLGRTELRNG